MGPIFRRAAAIAEILCLLLLGLLTVSLIGPTILPNLPGQDFTSPEMSALPAAISDGAKILLRFSILLAAGFLLLRLRFSLRPVDVGIGLGGKSIPLLLVWGLVAGAVAALPWKAVVLINKITPFGAGLDAWGTINQAGPRLDVVILVLLTGILLPPLLEETFVRGYVRGRLTLEFGPVGGILIAALIFALSHGHFYQDDAVVKVLGACSFFAAVVLGWVVWRSGSIVPAIIGHAILNLPEPASATAMATFVLGLTLIVVARVRVIASEIQAFGNRLRRESWHHFILAAPALGAVFTLLVARQELVPIIGGTALLTVGLDIVLRKWRGLGPTPARELSEGAGKGV